MRVITLGKTPRTGALGAQVSPNWYTQYNQLPPKTPQFPQNLLRATLQNGPMNMMGQSAQQALGHLGQAPPTGTQDLGPPVGTNSGDAQKARLEIPGWYKAVQVAGVAGGAYHGYARNQDVAWAVIWAVAGGLVPFITLPVSVAQGFGKRKR